MVKHPRILKKIEEIGKLLQNIFDSLLKMDGKFVDGHFSLYL